MSLPVEVLEAIVDQASDNPVSLGHLSLTCITLLPRSRYYLFSNLVIRTVQQLEASRDFLESCPWLALLVRKVTLSHETVPGFNLDPKPNLRILDVTPFHLLARLPNLRAWTVETVDREFVRIGRNPLSFHRFSLRCYRKHGDRIQSLELSAVIFDSRSDFTAFVSAFTSLDSLICEDIDFQSREQHSGSTTGTGTNVQLPQVSTLKICTSVNSWAVEYLLASSEPKLKHLTVQLRAADCRNGHFEYLQQSIARLTHLCSLALVIIPVDHLIERVEDRFSRVIRSTTTILEQVNRGCLIDVRVEFEADPLAELGARLSGASAPLEACQQLEAALLTFPNAPLLVGDPVRKRRVGRVKLWSPIIRRAFPRLDVRGLLTFNFTHMGHDATDSLGHEDEVTSIVISHDSAWAVTSSFDGTIIVWDIGSEKVLHEWPNHQGKRVVALALSPGGRRLVSAGANILAVWDINIDGTQKVAALGGSAEVINACASSPDGALIAATFLNGTVCVWDGHTFEQRGFLQVPEHRFSSGPRSLRFSPDSRYLAWISGGVDCHVWQPLSMGEQLQTFRPYPDPSNVVTTTFSFDHKSHYIATAHGSLYGNPDACVVRVWDVATGSVLAVLAGYSKTVFNILFSPDGKSLLSTSDGGSVWVWDRGTWSGQQIYVYGDAESLASRPCLRHDGKYIATASVQGLVQLWRTSDGECVATLDEHGGIVIRLAFSPNGQFLVSGDRQGIVHIHALSRFIGD